MLCHSYRKPSHQLTVFRQSAQAAQAALLSSYTWSKSLLADLDFVFALRCLCVDRQYSRHQAPPVLNRSFFTLLHPLSKPCMINILDSLGLPTLLEVHGALSNTVNSPHVLF